MKLFGDTDGARGEAHESEEAADDDRAFLGEIASAIGLRAVLMTEVRPDGELVACVSTDELDSVREGEMLEIESVPGLDERMLPVHDPAAGHVRGALRWIRGSSRSPLDEMELQAMSLAAQSLGGATSGPRRSRPAAASAARNGDGPTAVMRLLASLATRSIKTAWEEERVIQLSEAVARELGLSDEQTATVLDLAMLRDVGALGVSPQVFRKRGLLNHAEARELREQPVLGERIASSMPEVAHLAPLIRSSHERFDGSGYPDGLAAERVPLPCRIVNLCNAYAAMLAKRPYREPMSSETVQTLIEDGAGKQFCPRAVAALERVLERERHEGAGESSANDQPAIGVGGGDDGAEPEATGSDADPAGPQRSGTKTKTRGRRASARARLARGRTAGRAAKVLYSLGLLFSAVLGVIVALPIDSAEGRCPPSGAAGHNQCILQKVWLHELTVVFVVMVAVMLTGYLLIFKLPDIFRRWRAGELRHREPPAVTDDPAVLAATWGWTPDGDDQQMPQAEAQEEADAEVPAGSQESGPEARRRPPRRSAARGTPQGRPRARRSEGRGDSRDSRERRGGPGRPQVPTGGSEEPVGGRNGWRSSR